MFTAPSHSSLFRVAIASVLCGAFGACAKAGVVDNQPIPPPPGSDASLAADQRMGSDVPPLIIVFPDASPPPVYLDTAPVFVPQNIETMRIVPADSTISVQRGQSATVDFHAFATLKGGYPEIEITDRTVFYVPDNYLVGTFPADGGPTFTSRLPVAAADPPQRGGVLTVQAQAANSDDPPLTTVTTTLTVKIVDVIQPVAGTPAATPAIPADPGSSFTGSADPTLAPSLVYPNDGVLLPPNLGTVEIQFLPGKKTGELYELSLQSAFSDLRLYTRCYSDPAQFLSGTCVQNLDSATVDILSESNRGGPAVTLSVRGGDGSGAYGQATEASIQFAADRVDGAVYYWTTSNPPRIMRFDFGSQSALAPVLQPSDLPSDAGVAGGGTRCIGCHSLSRDGKRMAAAAGASYESYLVYLNDLTLPRTATSNWLTVDGRNNGPASQNRVLITSFNPDGSEFVAVAPNGSGTANSLMFHDGVTGLRKTTSDGTLTLPFTPAFPDWSPDGGSIAVTHIYGNNNSTIQFQEGGISVVTQGTAGWNLPPIEIVPHVVGKNRYNAMFVPDSSFLLYSESILQTSDNNNTNAVDAYSDPSAKTWAVAPVAGATAISLDKANASGVADKMTVVDSRDATLQAKIAAGQLMNTFPRAAPFANKQDGHKLFWFTTSSQRRAGLRKYYPNNSVVGDPPTQTLLWMFAIDADKTLAGQDGSYPGFFLPFQDMTTSNHMAIWAQKYVSDQPPPGPPPTPPPPAVPPPPPPPGPIPL